MLKRREGSWPPFSRAPLRQRRCGDEPSLLLFQAGRQDKAHIVIDGKTIRATTSTEEPVHRRELLRSADGAGPPALPSARKTT